MNELEKKAFFETYNKGTHRYGRIFNILGILMLLAMPFAMGAVLGSSPDFKGFLIGLAQVAVLYVPSCIVEFLIYTPMLGAGGSYLVITGNLVNLKIPCVLNAREIAGVKAGTPENEIVASLALAVSSLVCIVILAVGALLLIPLEPILSAPVLQPAFENVVPALFGALAYQFYRKGLKIVVVPLALMVALCIFVPSLINATSYMMLVSGALAIGIAFLLFRKGKLS